MENKFSKKGNSLHIAAISPRRLNVYLTWLKWLTKKIVENKYCENKFSKKNFA
jgi:hypothetical protein